jgi:hypothetical protein
LAGLRAQYLQQLGAELLRSPVEAAVVAAEDGCLGAQPPRQSKATLMGELARGLGAGRWHDPAGARLERLDVGPVAGKCCGCSGRRRTESKSDPD